MLLRKFKEHKSALSSAAISPDSCRLQCISISPDSQCIASGSSGGDGSTKLWDAHTGQCVHTLSSHGGGVLCVDFSKDGKFLASGGGYGDSSLRMWVLRDGQAPTTLQNMKAHASCVRSVRFSPDCCRVVSASDDGKAVIWSVQSGEQLLTFRGHQGHRVYSAVWSPDGQLVASGGHDEVILLWSADNGAKVMEPLQGHKGGILCIVFGAKRNILVSGSVDRTIIVWELGELRQAAIKHRLQGHPDWVRSIALSPDDRYRQCKR